MIFILVQCRLYEIYKSKWSNMWCTSKVRALLWIWGFILHIRSIVHSNYIVASSMAVFVVYNISKSSWYFMRAHITQSSNYTLITHFHRISLAGFWIYVVFCAWETEYNTVEVNKPPKHSLYFLCMLHLCASTGWMDFPSWCCSWR